MAQQRKTKITLDMLIWDKGTTQNNPNNIFAQDSAKLKGVQQTYEHCYLVTKLLTTSVKTNNFIWDNIKFHNSSKNSILVMLDTFYLGQRQTREHPK